MLHFLTSHTLRLSIYIFIFNFRYDRVFMPYPTKTHGMIHDQHKILCQIKKSSKLHLKYLCENTLHTDNFVQVDPATETRHKAIA